MNRTHASEDSLQAIRNGVGEIGATIKDVSEAVKDAVTEKFDELRDGAYELTGQGREQAKAARDAVQKNIEDRPWPAVFIAAGLGAAFGMWFARRR
jgi:ElaB/YqjD/DUF883 family membrane-anchored ribosome-binding protein